MKRYVFTRNMLKPYEDIRIIESYYDYSQLPLQYGYELFSITKI
jgi:hypothetical protein